MAGPSPLSLYVALTVCFFFQKVYPSFDKMDCMSLLFGNLQQVQFKAVSERLRPLLCQWLKLILDYNAGRMGRHTDSCLLSNYT